MAQKKVMAFGTFDRLHLGHEAYLKQAKALGDYLIVVVSRDKTVRKIKGHLPDWDEKRRKDAVLRSVSPDKVILGNIDDKYDVIKKFRPDVIALGYDQFIFIFKLRKLLIDEKIDAKIVRLNPYRQDIFKTSILKQANAYTPQAHA